MTIQNCYHEKMNWKDNFPKENIYFETENGLILNGNCIEIMKSLPRESIDLILTDPPYNISKKDKIIRNGGEFGKAKAINLDFGEWDHGTIQWKDFISAFNAVLTRVGVLAMFYDKLEIGCIGKYLNSTGWKVRQKHYLRRKNNEQ